MDTDYKSYIEACELSGWFRLPEPVVGWRINRNVSYFADLMLASVVRKEPVLMPATSIQIAEFLASDEWTDDERAVIMWQFGICGDFGTALWRAIALADGNNQERLARGFPLQVAGFRKWAEGDLAERLRKAGLDI